jgi:hypothetical protein
VRHLALALLVVGCESSKPPERPVPWMTASMQHDVHFVKGGSVELSLPQGATAHVNGARLEWRMMGLRDDELFGYVLVDTDVEPVVMPVSGEAAATEALRDRPAPRAVTSEEVPAGFAVSIEHERSVEVQVWRAADHGALRCTVIGSPRRKGGIERLREICLSAITYRR